MERTNVKAREREKAMPRRSGTLGSVNHAAAAPDVSQPQGSAYTARTRTHTHATRASLSPPQAQWVRPSPLDSSAGARQDLTQLSRSPLLASNVELSQGGQQQQHAPRGRVQHAERLKTLSRTDQQTARNEPVRKRGARATLGVFGAQPPRRHPMLQGPSRPVTTGGNNRAPPKRIALWASPTRTFEASADWNEASAFVMATSLREAAKATAGGARASNAKARRGVLAVPHITRHPLHAAVCNRISARLPKSGGRVAASGSRSARAVRAGTQFPPRNSDARTRLADGERHG
ncbi:hypothetical protein HPB50_025587 [Hyalomma asiaticum]|uniref:Uncharacterized protein n=1 Tax=Hyalomma asiaticum TaxID=266040 RepID=A0ACB7TNR2_HYAAI|nr:hypothetical protein HPB50_025587 [Hyalomma asiaticum]